MPKRILRSHRARWALLIFAAYWALSPFVNVVYVAQMLAIVLIFVVFGVLSKYSRQVWKAIVEDNHDAVSQLAQGIWLGFLGLGIGLVWSILGRLYPGGEWMRYSPMVGFYLLCYIVAGTLHMTARRDEHGRVPREDLRDVLMAYMLGLMVSVLLMFVQMGGVISAA